MDSVEMSTRGLRPRVDILTSGHNTVLHLRHLYNVITLCWYPDVCLFVCLFVCLSAKRITWKFSSDLHQSLQDHGLLLWQNLVKFRGFLIQRGQKRPFWDFSWWWRHPVNSLNINCFFFHSHSPDGVCVMCMWTCIFCGGVRSSGGL